MTEEAKVLVDGLGGGKTTGDKEDFPIYTESLVDMSVIKPED